MNLTGETLLSTFDQVNVKGTMRNKKAQKNEFRMLIEFFKDDNPLISEKLEQKGIPSIIMVPSHILSLTHSSKLNWQLLPDLLKSNDLVILFWKPNVSLFIPLNSIEPFFAPKITKKPFREDVQKVYIKGGEKFAPVYYINDELHYVFWRGEWVYYDTEEEALLYWEE